MSQRFQPLELQLHRYLQCQEAEVKQAEEQLVLSLYHEFTKVVSSLWRDHKDNPRGFEGEDVVNASLLEVLKLLRDLRAQRRPIPDNLRRYTLGILQQKLRESRSHPAARPFRQLLYRSIASDSASATWRWQGKVCCGKNEWSGKPPYASGNRLLQLLQNPETFLEEFSPFPLDESLEFSRLQRLSRGMFSRVNAPLLGAFLAGYLFRLLGYHKEVLKLSEITVTAFPEHEQNGPLDVDEVQTLKQVIANIAGAKRIVFLNLLAEQDLIRCFSLTELQKMVTEALGEDKITPLSLIARLPFDSDAEMAEYLDQIGVKTARGTQINVATIYDWRREVNQRIQSGSREVQ